MALKLTQLETFYWIARLGTFHAAARKLNLAQPTLSARIRELEAAVGASLFAREGRQVRLTSEGNRLLPHAESMVLLVEQIEQKVRQRDPLHGLLRLGVPDSFAMVCLPRLLAEIETEHPGLDVQITVDASASLARGLSDGVLDLAIFMDVEPGEEVRVERLGNLTVAWVASAKLPLPKRAVRPEELCVHRVITNPHPGPLFGMVADWFAAAGRKPERLITCNNLSAIARLVASGVGVALLPLPIIRLELQSGGLVIVPVHPPVPRSTVFAGYPLKRKLSVASPVIVEKARALLIETDFMASL